MCTQLFVHLKQSHKYFQAWLLLSWRYFQAFIEKKPHKTRRLRLKSVRFTLGSLFTENWRKFSLTFCGQTLLSYGSCWVEPRQLNMLICICKWGHRSTNATCFGRPWLTLTKEWAQDSPECVFTKSKMAAILCDLHSKWHTCMWGTTRQLNHVSLNMLQARIAKLHAGYVELSQPMLELPRGRQLNMLKICQNHFEPILAKSKKNWHWVAQGGQGWGSGLTQHGQKIKNA